MSNIEKVVEKENAIFDEVVEEIDAEVLTEEIDAEVLEDEEN